MNLEKIKRLEELVANYHKTKMGYEEILSLLAYTIYKFPLRDQRCTEDDCGDFYLYFIPGLRRILKRHKPGMRTFYGFLKQILKWRLSSYCIKKNRVKLCQAVENHDSMWNDPNHKHMRFNKWDEKSIHQIFNASEEKPMHKTFDKRLLLASSLKYSSNIAEENWDRIIKITETDRNWLNMKRREIQDLIQAKMEYYFKWIKRRNKCYFKIRYNENILKLLNHPESIQKMKKKIRKLWELYNRMIFKISAIRLTPSRIDIAKLLNIPKGTLDTSFSTLNHRLTKLEKAEELKYPL